jgi:hypothetical protein
MASTVANTTINRSETLFKDLAEYERQLANNQQRVILWQTKVDAAKAELFQIEQAAASFSGPIGGDSDVQAWFPANAQRFSNANPV